MEFFNEKRFFLMRKLHIFKLIRIFLFSVCVGEIFGESAYGMDTQFNPVVIPEYSSSVHKTPSNYLQIVTSTLAALPTGHPCKSLTSAEKIPNKLRADILSKCSAILSQANATALELQKKLQAEEILRKQKEAALAQEKFLHAQKQQQLAEEQKKAALLKQQQEAQEALIKQQQEAAAKAALLKQQQDAAAALAKKKAEEQEALIKQQQEAATKAVLLKQQQEEATKVASIKQQQEEQQKATLVKQQQEEKAKAEEQAALIKQHEVELARQAALLEQQKQLHQAELLKARQQIESLQAQQPHRINEQIQQFEFQSEVAISSLIGLVFNIDDKKKRPSITKNSAFLKEYSDFLLVHTANVEQDEKIPQLKGFLKIPNRRQDTPEDVDNLNNLNKAIDAGVAAINAINIQLQALTDTSSENYRDISTEIFDVTRHIQKGWSVVEKFNYLKGKLTPLEYLMGNLLGAPLLMSKNDDQINKLSPQFKNKAFAVILANPEQYINFFQLWALITKEKIVEKIDFEFYGEVGSGVAKLLKSKDPVKTLNDKMKEALGNAVKWRKSFDEIKKTQETNEICDFFSHLEESILLHYTTYHKNMTQIQEKSKKAGTEFMAARVGARDRLMNQNQDKVINIAKSKINNTSKFSITAKLKIAQANVLSAIDNWVATSLTSPDNQSDISKVDEALEDVAVKGSEEFNIVLKNLKDVVEPAIEGFTKNQRFYKLSENILMLNRAHHDLLKQIAALPKLTSDYKIEDKEQTFLSVNIRLLKESFSKNLTAGTFNNYLDLPPEERANLYSHVIKMLGIDFPKAPTSKLNLAVDIFPEISLDSEKEKYRAQFKKLYDSYFLIQKAIQNLNLGGEEVSVPGDKVEFIDLAAPINIPNLLPLGSSSQGGPPPPPNSSSGAPSGNGPPPPPGGLSNKAMHPGEADEIEKIKGFQVSLLPLLEKIEKWESTVPLKIVNEKAYKDMLKAYYTNLYSTIGDFYAKIGNPYPTAADQSKKFISVAEKIFEETFTYYNKKSSVKGVKAFSNYYLTLLEAAINNDQHPLPSLKTENDVDALIVAFLTTHPDQKPAQKPQNLNQGLPGQNANPGQNLKSIVKMVIMPLVTTTDLGADLVVRIKNGEKINFDTLAKPVNISDQQWDDEKSKLIIYQFELRDLPRFSLKTEIEASGWTGVDRENTLKIAYDLVNKKTSLATLQHVNALPDEDLATALMYDVMIQIITEKMKLVQQITPEINNHLQEIWQNKSGLTNMLKLASDIREKKPLADLQQLWVQIKYEFNNKPEKELVCNLAAYLALSDLAQGMNMVKTQIWNDGEGYLNYLLEQVDVNNVPDVNIKDKLKAKWALLRS